VDTDRWARIQQLFHAILELPPSERAEFLSQACPNDPELGREVESLLAFEGQADGLLESPVWSAIRPGEATTPAPPAMAAGSQLGVFRIVEFLGAGGMGEVYRATDSKLNREVAIKVLPESFASDPERLARFTREAKVLALLNHPNIAQIYGVEESNNVRALVMELVPGKPLKGPLALETALNYARQIAGALEAAHDKGIIHRDLKPGNVMVTPEGVVKVLDFGLAAVAPTSAGDSAKSPTMAMAETQAGTIMGTAAYMSPEQAVGKPVDKRTDIWSFGVVLWELLTGHRLFEGETVSHTLAEVLRGPIAFRQPPVGAERAGVARSRGSEWRRRLGSLFGFGQWRSGVPAKRRVRPAAHLVRPGGQGHGNRGGTGRLFWSPGAFAGWDAAGRGEEQRGGRKEHLAAGSLPRRREHTVYVWFGHGYKSGLVAGWEPHYL